MPERILQGTLPSQTPSVSSQPTPKPEREKRGIFSRWGDTIEKRTKSFAEIWKRQAKGEQNPLETGIQQVGGIVGGVGDLAMDTVAAVTPEPIKEVGEKALGAFAQTQIGQDVGSLAAKYDKWAKLHPRAAADLSGLVDIASLIPIGKGAKVGGEALEQGAKEVAKGTAKKVAGKLDDQFLKEALDVVAPTLNKKAKKSAIKAGRIETNILGTSSLTPSSRELEIADVVKNVVKKKANPEANLQAIKDSISVDAQKVDEYLKANDGIFNDAQLKSVLDQAKSQSEVLFGSDKSLEGAYDAVVKEYFKQLGKTKNSLSGAWDARKAFDDVIEAKLPKAFSKDIGDNIRANAVRDVRQAVNDYIAEGLPDGSVYKDAMTKMNLKYEAIDNIVDSSVGKVGKGALERLAMQISKNPIVSGAGLLGGGAATALAAPTIIGVLTNPVALGTILAGGTIYLGKKAVTSKAAKKMLLQLIKQAEKASSKGAAKAAVGGAEAAGVQELKKILDLLEDQGSDDKADKGKED